MSQNHWETQPRKSNGEFTYRVGRGFTQRAIDQALAKVKDDEIRKTTRGGSYGELRKITSGNNNYEIHHMPAASASPLSRWKGPCIIMHKNDHSKTSSYRNSKKSRAYREEQKRLIQKGYFLEAELMDINEIREFFGTRYDNAINEKLSYEEKLENEGKIYEKA